MQRRDVEQVTTRWLDTEEVMVDPSFPLFAILKSKPLSGLQGFVERNLHLHTATGRIDAEQPGGGGS
jgi:hypothetical protein